MLFLSRLRFPFVLFLLLILSACGSGGDGEGQNTEDEDIDVSVNPSELLYGDGTSYSPGQVIVLESATPFVEGETVSATDSNGNVVEIVGQSDGSAFFLLPVDIEAGSYSLSMTRGSSTSKLVIDVAAVSFPQNPKVYLSEFLNQLIMTINTVVVGQGDSADAALVNLLNELQNVDLDTLSEEQIRYLSNLLYINANFLVEEPAPANVLSALSYSVMASSACRQAKAGMLLSAIPLVALAGVGAVDPDPISKAIFIGATVAAGYNFGDSIGEVLDKCLGRVINAFAQNVQSSSTLVNLSLRPLAVSGEPGVRYATATNAAKLDFYDMETCALSITATAVPDAETLSVINKFKASVNFASEILPSDFVAYVNSLGETKEKDLTNESSLEQISGTVNCSGNTSAYTCGFPAEDEIYGSPEEFSFKIFHEQSTEAIATQSARVLPRDVPVIDDQSFSVTPGPGQVNRIVIQVTEDTTSPNYELTKVIGYELISPPSYGVILNEFNEPGVIDYAADITESTPESTSLEVRAWNRYGWSGTATITLNMATAANIEVTNAAGSITSDITPFDFGDVETDTGKVQDLFIWNTGETDLQISNVSLYGADQNAYSINPLASNVIPAQGVNSSILTVTFMPTELRTYTAGITINSNDPDTPAFNIPLEGTGICAADAPPPEILGVTRICLDDWTHAYDVAIRSETGIRPSSGFGYSNEPFALFWFNQGIADNPDGGDPWVDNTRYNRQERTSGDEFDGVVRLHFDELADVRACAPTQVPGGGGGIVYWTTQYPHVDLKVVVQNQCGLSSEFVFPTYYYIPTPTQ